MAREGTIEEWIDSFTSAAHHLGTARMAATPSRGVVNPSLQVFGVENLYVCDASVFPTSGSANPSLTITALGVRLAQYLLQGRRVQDRPVHNPLIPDQLIPNQLSCADPA